MKREEEAHKKVTTQKLDNGHTVTREQYVKQYLSPMSEDSIQFIFDGMTMLDGYKGVVYFLLNDSVSLLKRYLDAPLTNETWEDYYYFLTNLTTLHELVCLREIDSFQAAMRNIELENHEGMRVIRSFTLDPSYEFNLTEKIYLSNLIIGCVKEIQQSAGPENVDISSILIFFEAMCKLRYKNLSSKQRIVKMDLHTGQDDRLIDVDIKTIEGSYSEDEYRNMSAVLFIQFVAYDTRQNEEKILESKYPYFHKDSIKDLAISQYNQGKARGVSSSNSFSDLSWKKNSILPLLTVFENEIRHVTNDLLNFVEISDRYHVNDSELFKSIRKIKYDDKLVNRIDAFKKMITTSITSNNKKYKDTEMSKDRQRKIVFFFKKIDTIRKIRNKVMHGNNISKTEMDIISDYVPAVLHIIHHYLTLEVSSDNIIDDNNNPYWLMAYSDILYNRVLFPDKDL